MAGNLEQNIRETGRRLFRLAEGETPAIYRKDYWTGRIISWCMSNETFKVEMFRFIDVFPSLSRPEAIAKHLQEYFCRPGLDLPGALQWGLKSISPSSLTAKLAAKTLTHNMSKMARQFIVGSTPEEAVATLTDLRSSGIAFTADLLGEAVVSEREAEEYLGRYLELFNRFQGVAPSWPALGGGSDLDWDHTPKINVSIKPSAMYSQMNACAFEHSVESAKERLRPILRKAIQAGAFFGLDMEHWGLKNLTLAIYRSLMEEPEFRDYPHTGIALQCYLRDSEKDLRELISWAKHRGTDFTIRLVKGAYWDSEVIWARQNNWPVPVFTNKHETDANFERLARIILDHHPFFRLACASHNFRAIASVMETARELKVPENRLEYQVIYGMGEPVRNALRKAGLPVRVYAPIGELLQGMAYLVRRLLENTANESFLRRSFAEGLSVEEALRNPLELVLSPSPVASDSQQGLTGPGSPFQNEPRWDWNRVEHRDRFSEALQRVRRTFPRKIPIVIGRDALWTDQRISSTNPNDPDEVVGVAAAAGEAEAERAVETAYGAFPQWRDTDCGERAAVLFRAAALARHLRYDLAALQVYEVGKSWSEADADVCEAIDFLEYYAREMLRLGSPRRMGRAPAELSHLFYEPRGVCVVVAPWNFPLAIAMGMTSAAVVTGNTVVFKPSSQSPATGAMVHKLLTEAGLPPNALSFLPGSGGTIGNFLVTHPKVAAVAFTGSMETGLKIIELAAGTVPGSVGVKHVVAEMGGKNAIVVDADADLDEAVVHILHSAFGYQGQKCSACSRVIVLEEIHDRLVDRLKAAVESIHVGPVVEPENIVGAVIDRAALEKIRRYIEIGRAEGSVLLERSVPTQKGYFAPITVFTGILPEHRIAREEIFGPVLAVMKARDFPEALKIANDTAFALTGSVFSRSPHHIAYARREFRVGNLYINRGCTGALVERHPFGGFKMSGLGSKAGGPDYLLQFMVPRNVVENTMRRGFAPGED